MSTNMACDIQMEVKFFIWEKYHTVTHITVYTHTKNKGSILHNRVLVNLS